MSNSDKLAYIVVGGAALFAVLKIKSGVDSTVAQATAPLTQLNEGIASAKKSAGTVAFTEGADKLASLSFAQQYGAGYLRQTIVPGQSQLGKQGQLVINDPRFTGGVAVYPAGSNGLDVLAGTGGYSSSTALLKKSGKL